MVLVIDSGPVQKNIVYSIFLLCQRLKLKKKPSSYTEPQSEELLVEFLCVPFKTWYFNIMNNKSRQNTLKAAYCSFKDRFWASVTEKCYREELMWNKVLGVVRMSLLNPGIRKPRLTLPAVENACPFSCLTEPRSRYPQCTPTLTSCWSWTRRALVRTFKEQCALSPSLSWLSKQSCKMHRSIRV